MKQVAVLILSFLALPLHHGTVEVSAIPEKIRKTYELDAFYEKYLDADGLPVVSSSKVSDEAFYAAHDLLRKMFEKVPRMMRPLKRRKIRLAIMAHDEVTVDIPEHSDLNDDFDRTGKGTDWNRRARGLGATRWRPACSVGEENLLGMKSDRYRGESILIHEFAHTLHRIAIVELDKKFERELKAAYTEALAAGKWANTYAATNEAEYWAEGVQSWFDANLSSQPPNGIHNEIDTRGELLDYDPKLAAIIAKWLPGDEWRFEYPERR